jgi:hypothetical protein
LVPRRSILELSASALILWAFCAMVSVFWLPGASYLFIWPVISGAIGLLITIFLARKRRPERSGTSAALIANAAFALPAVLLLAPVVYMLFINFRMWAPWVPASLTGFGLCLVSPLFSEQQPSRTRWGSPLLAFVCFAALLTAVSSASGWDKTHRKLTSLMYFEDADRSRSTWATVMSQPDEWTGQFLGSMRKNIDVSAFTPWVTQRVIGADAPVSGLKPPDIEVVDDRLDDRQRSVRIRITPQRGANGTMLIGTDGQEILQATVDGLELDPVETGGKGRYDGPLRVLYVSPPRGSFEVNLHVAAGQPLRLGVEDLYFGLPAAFMEKASPRPAYMMPAPLMLLSDTTLIRREIELPAR